MAPSAATKPPRSFAKDATGSFVAVRKALGDWLAAVPGEHQRPTDLQRVLDLDSKICWQIFNVTRAEEALAAARYVPTMPALKRALAAAERLGVARQLSESVRRAIEAFERVVELHAGSRSDFDAMASALVGDESSAAAELRQRRSVYRGLSHIWGTQLDCFSTATLVRRSGDATDQLLLSRKRGLRRLRPDAHIDVYGWRISATPADPPEQMLPLDVETAERCGAPLLPEFCSQPEPRFNQIADRDGWVRLELAEEGIGRLSAVDLAFGTRLVGVPLPQDSDGRGWFGSNILSTTPAGLLVMDLLVHRGSFGAVRPEVLAFPNVPGSDMPTAMRRLALPLSERVVALGPGDQLARSPEVPQHLEMLRHACGVAGWELAEFDVFRVRVEYPILNAVVRVFFHV